MIEKIKSPSFTGYVPVTYFAKHPSRDEYVPVLKKENMRKCNGYLVRNLNGTAKNIKDQGLVDFFKSSDEDYQKRPFVHSLYDIKTSVVYLVTGDDAANVKELAHPLGIAKGEAIERTGKPKSFEVTCAARDYVSNALSYIAKKCKRLKSKEGEDLSLQIYFDPKYNKKNKLISFEFNHARFVDKKGNERVYPIETK